MKKYATCNYDKKQLHPDDKKAIEEFLEYRKQRGKKLSTLPIKEENQK